MSVAAFLGRVLSADGRPVGTCFHVASGVVVTSWHVLAAAAAGEVGRVVTVDPLTGGDAVEATVTRIDPVHDLAVLSLPGDALTWVVEGFATTGHQSTATPVVVAGAAGATRFVEVSGVLDGGTTLDGVALGRVEARIVAALPVMAGAPVRRGEDGFVVGMVSAVASGLPDSVWVVRVEDILSLLHGLADPFVRRPPAAAAVDVSVVVDAAAVTVIGQGRQARAPHRGMVAGLRIELDRFVRARSGLAAQRDLAPDPRAAAMRPPVEAVGRSLTETFLPDAAGALFAEALIRGRSMHSPARIGLRVADEFAALPWETLVAPGTDRPIGLDPQVRTFRQTPSRLVALPGPLRILVAIASPLSGGGMVLDYERELRNVLAAVRGARAHTADVRVVQFATTGAIRAALTQYPVHVLHLSGHGEPGLLELEDDAGAARRVSADELLDEAVPAGRMPAVFSLAACHTGRLQQDGNASFAAGLLARGAGVVIATETSISDIYATKVFARVYGVLAADPAADVIAAVADARAAVHLELRRSADPRDRALAELHEWATVAVYAPRGSVPVIDPAAAVQHPPDAGLRRGVLRRAVGEVVGRRREQRIWPAQLLGGRTAGIVVHGLGGVGKTTLADELVTRVLEREADRLVVAVTGQSSAEQLLAAIAEQAAEALHDRAAVPAGVWRGLSRLTDGALGIASRTGTLTGLLTDLPVLLVLDNFEDNLSGAGAGPVDDPALAGLLAAVIDRPGRCRLLVTCRYPFTLPRNGHRGLAFHQLGPLTFAETMKLAWALPYLDRMTSDELRQVWRSVGGHPRCLEYLDALLAGGVARYTDVTRRLADAAEHRLRGTPGPHRDIDDYLGAHTTLDAALAETATLAADDVLLDDLLGTLVPHPGADRVLLGAAVHRRPVDHTAIAFQIAANGADPPDMRYISDEPIQRLLTSAGFGQGLPSNLDTMPAVVRQLFKPLRAQREPPPRVPPGVDLAPLVRAGVDAGLITADEDEHGPRVFVHRWTATELIRRAIRTGDVGLVVDAHLRAARYWRRRAATRTQPATADADDLQEAHHHLRAAATLDPALDSADLAGVCNQLQFVLGDLGRRHDALAFSREHLDLCRRRHAAQPSQPHLFAVAAGLNHHAVRLGDVGRLDEALDVAAASVDAYRQLAAANPAEFRDSLAAAVNNLGTRLLALRRYEEAHALILEAVTVYRQLTAEQPAVFRSQLARALNNLGDVLSALHRSEEGLAVLPEGIAMLRDLAAADPAMYEPLLAQGLNMLGSLLMTAKRHGEAATVQAEAIGMFRRLAGASPAVYEGALGSALTHATMTLSILDRRDEALAAATEATEMFRRLAAANPAAFEPELGSALTSLAFLLSRSQRDEEAFAAVAESIELHRRLAATNQAAFTPALVMARRVFDLMLSAAYRQDEALAVGAQIAGVHRRLAAADPVAREPLLGEGLADLAARLAQAGRWDEAVTAGAEAVEIHRRLAAADPARFDPDLAGALHDVASILAEGGRRDEAAATLAALRRAGRTPQ